MTVRRALALLLGLLAIALAVSIPFAIVSHFRDRSRHSLGGVANGIVVVVERNGGEYSMVVEFRVSPGVAPRRLRWPDETVGLVRPRPRRQPGDPVLVAYDPRDPSIAEVFDIRPIWTAIMRRVFLAAVLLIAALLLFRGGGSNRSAAPRPSE
jgi:hypothetical protein